MKFRTLQVTNNPDDEWSDQCHLYDNPREDAMGSVSRTFHGRTFALPFRLAHVSRAGTGSTWPVCQTKTNQLWPPWGPLQTRRAGLHRRSQRDTWNLWAGGTQRTPRQLLAVSKSGVSLSTAVNVAERWLPKPQSDSKGGQWGLVTREG